MTSSELLIDAYDRIQQRVRGVTEDLSVEALAYRPDPDANSIAWLIWHLTRVQDDHIAAAAGQPQIWIEGDWQERFALPFAPDATGYGHSSSEVGELAGATAAILYSYHDAVHAATARFLQTIDDAALSRVIDTRWDPPVTLGVRLVSVVDDSLEHVGQAAYIKGLLARKA